jgi:3-oxo-5-alpha-steroid 4-dehydrogenase 1
MVCYNGFERDIYLTMSLGTVGWMLMEIASPASFLLTYMTAPFSSSSKPPPFLHPSTLLAALFVLHYLNRAIISPLRSPGRSRMHVVVVFAAIIFNLINAPLMAGFLSAPYTYPPPLQPLTAANSSISDNYFQSQMTSNKQWIIQPQTKSNYIHPIVSWTDPSFIIGIAMFAVGLVSNICHDEVLYNLRRGKPNKEGEKHHYEIPRGYLYKYISYPNYFSEWIEFVGFALAACPRWEYTPPWMFVVAEVMVMLPRAYKGHQWYKQKFPDYPKERKAIIPYVL